MIKVHAKVEGGWQTLNKNEPNSNTNQGSTEISDYIYQERDGVIIECMVTNLSADGTLDRIEEEIKLKKPFNNSIITCNVDCDSTVYWNCNLIVSAVPSGKDKVKVRIRHVTDEKKLKGGFTLYLTCFGY